MNKQKSSFEQAALDLFDKAIENVQASLIGRPQPHPLPKPEPLEYVPFECIMPHTRTGQDIFGRHDYKRGEIAYVLKETVDAGDTDYVINSKYFRRLAGTIKR